MIFKESNLTVSQGNGIPLEVQKELQDKCIYIIVNCLDQQVNEDSLKRLIVEELRERKIQLTIESIAVKTPLAYVEVNSLPGDKLFVIIK